MSNRLYAPSSARNKDVIRDQLIDRIPPHARVLEIASGSGEHGHNMCAARTDIYWQFSDPNAQSRASQNDWAADFGDRLPPALDIDVTGNDWWAGLPGFDAIYCANMIHIAPWAACLGLAKGAAHLLKPKGLMIFYGPFIEDGNTAPSNLEFDQNLKSRNPEWGVRNLDSVKHIFADSGFNLGARIEMPTENRLLIFTKSL